MLLKISIDGASRGNPGLAGIGVSICAKSGKKVKNIKKFLGETTNNVAEYEALNCALEAARVLKAKEIHIKSDSQLLVNQLNQTYKVKDAKMKVLYSQALGKIKHFDKVKITHVVREDNKEADRLANEAIDEANKSKQFHGNAAIFEHKKVAIFRDNSGFPESLF